jgi:uncharacterized membrane protein
MNNEDRNNKNWHDKDKERLTLGQRVADKVANGMGSWTFIIGQSLFVVLWIILNLLAYINRWDPYPFILLNLLFSLQAAYAAPVIMMAQNRQNERDRYHAEQDFLTNLKAKEEIEELQKAIYRIENEKLIEIIELLKKIPSSPITPENQKLN